MKKIFTLLLTALCALSVAAFAGCYQTKLSQSEWLAAVSVTDNFYNVTITYTSGTVTQTSSSTTTEEETGSFKVNLTDNNSVATGIIYASYTNSYLQKSSTGEKSYSNDYIYYGKYTESSYEMVLSYADAGTTNLGWVPLLYDGAQQIDEEFLSGLTALYSYLSVLAEADYGALGYDDGVYTYSSDGITLELTYLQNAVTMLKVTDCSSEGVTKTFKYKFSAYGTTSVTIPEEYTYEYCLANNQSLF